MHYNMMMQQCINLTNRQPTAEELERASHTCPVCLDRWSYEDNIDLAEIYFLDKHRIAIMKILINMDCENLDRHGIGLENKNSG